MNPLSPVKRILIRRYLQVVTHGVMVHRSLVRVVLSLFVRVRSLSSSAVLVSCGVQVGVPISMYLSIVAVPMSMPIDIAVSVLIHHNSWGYNST